MHWALIAWLAVASSAVAQQSLHIGYVYPGGGQQGTTFEAVVGGQFLTGVDHVYVSGNGVTGRVTGLVQPINGKELNALRIRVDELMARKAVVRNDFRALENFRSFKNAKSAKPNDATHDKELEELKQKYAGATWTADDEKQLTEARKKISGAVRRPANPAICELAVLEVTVAPHAATGPRDLRIASPAGLSNPLTFCIGHLPESSEPPSKTITQQKSAISKTALVPKSRKKEADPEITLPAVVNGQILPGEVDRYRFQAKQGQRLVATASARQLIPYIPDAVPGWFQATLAIYDAEGKELAYDDDFRFHPDPVLYCRIPADGEYTMAIKDAIYRGREDFVYRVTIGEQPFVTSIFPLGGPVGVTSTVEVKGWNLPVKRLTMDGRGKAPGIYPLGIERGGRLSNRVPFALDTLPECLEQEPNHQHDAAQRVALPVTINGRIDPPGDADVFCFAGRAGAEIVAEVYARRLNSPLDSVLKLLDASGRMLVRNDDREDKSSGLHTHHADSYLRCTLPSDGTYYVHLTDMQRKGGPEYAYRLRISAPRPDFDLRVVPASIFARYSRTVPLTVYALRKDGFAGPIDLALANAAEGFALSGGRIPAGVDRLRLTLTVPAAPAQEPYRVRLIGRATIEGQTVSHPVVPAEDMMQAFEYRHLVPVQEFEVGVSDRPMAKAALKVLSPAPARIPVGGTARVEVGAPYNKVLQRFQFELDDAPDGITLKAATPTRDGVELEFAADAARVKSGVTGNLIVAILPGRDNQAGKSKPKAKPQTTPRRAAMAVLPAIPFEVVAAK
jgi:hypothetical protein